MFLSFVFNIFFILLIIIILVCRLFFINIFYFIFSHTTSQNNIHSKQTKQNNRHILHVLKVQSKGRERGREKVTTKQVLPLYNHVRKKKKKKLN